MRKIQIIAVLLFLLLVGVGLWKAAHRELWNDEYYSLFSSITHISYGKILSGGIVEGNNSPLFYTLQKLQCDLFSYHPPREWANGHWSGGHPYDCVFLRVQPVVMTAMALVALFYYFSRRNSLLWGFYALGMALTSSVMLEHWTECRPYALWFTLSIFQMLILWDALQAPKADLEKNLRALIVVHCFLALTSTISAVQIVAAGCVLGILGQRSWKLFLGAVMVPLGTILVYFYLAPKYDFFFINGPVSLISANFPKERLFLALIFAAVFLYGRRGKKKWVWMPETGYWTFMLLMLAFFSVILLKLKLSDTGHGFQIPGRYVMSLAPLSIIGTTIFSIYLVRAYTSRVWQSVIVVLLVALLAFRIHQMV